MRHLVHVLAPHSVPNRLAAESSPYLRQHADNPVDWYPWGSEAFERAVTEDRPILLSVGYAACHWCHVMAHESFEDGETAALMNRLFVNVKVDREERPDVDAIYMQAVQAMTGHGGWPMTVVLTPQGEPYWGGTYFPLLDRPGLPSFKRVIASVAEAWRSRRDAVSRTTAAMRELYANAKQPTGPTGVLEPEVLERAFQTLARQFDAVHGGFGGAPKFPSTMALDFCLRWYAHSGDAQARDIVHHSFRQMANGGLYDQVGGGFHRYSVDARWLVPHFEKMLYDNALLALLGVHLWQVTRDPDVQRVVEETFAWVMREMTAPSGGFYASLDADSEGHEGKFYVWEGAELDALLGDDAPVMRIVWGATDAGNFEEMNILHRPIDVPAIARQFNRHPQAVHDAIARATSLLYEERARRVWPGRDEKILASWNGLMTRAFAEAARVFDRADWQDVATKNGDFLRTTLMRGDRVMRVHTAGETKVPGFLDDHAAVALAFVALHEATLDGRWLDDARRVAESMHQHFCDPATGTWYDTADDAEALITRPRELFDNAVPAGQSLALELMVRFAELDGDERRRDEALRQLAELVDPVTKWPNGFGHVLGVIDLAMSGAAAVALVGPAEAEMTRALTRALADVYLPRLVLAAGHGSPPYAARLLEGRGLLNGRSAAYVCRGFACELPSSEPATLRTQLEPYGYFRNSSELG